MKYVLEKLPDDEQGRLYCSLSMAQLLLEEQSRHPLKYESKSRSTKKKLIPPLAFNGANLEEVKFLWTALMILGPSYIKGFNHNYISVPYNLNVKNELGMFSTFSSESLYHRVFRPIKKKFAQYGENESEKDFAFYVPDDQLELKNQVTYYMASTIKKSFFNCQGGVCQFKADTDPQQFYSLGLQKTAVTMLLIAEELFDLSAKKLNSVDILQLKAMFQNLSFIKTLNLSHNTLWDLKENEGDIYNHKNYFAEVISALPENVDTLILNYNDLFRVDPNVLAVALSQFSIKKVSTTISLEGNNLDFLGGTGVATILCALPAGTKVNLRNNGLENLKYEERSFLNAFILKNKLQVDWEGNNDPGLQEEMKLLEKYLSKTEVPSRSTVKKASSQYKLRGINGLFQSSMDTKNPLLNDPNSEELGSDVLNFS